MATAAFKKSVRKIFRMNPLNRYDYLADKAALRDWIDACTENGKIAICRSGMDCDGVQYASVRHVQAPVSIIQFMKDEDEHRAYLDGPEYMRIAKPSDEPEDYRSRDRALEAYEDGHPSVLHWGSLDD